MDSDDLGDNLLCMKSFLPSLSIFVGVRYKRKRDKKYRREREKDKNRCLAFG
jgi:hypothetical protein